MIIGDQQFLSNFPPFPPINDGAMPFSPVNLPSTILDGLTSEESSNLLESKEESAGKIGFHVSDIFRLYFDDYRKNNSVTPRQSKVVYDILNCRTGSFGYSISACDNCGHTEVFLNSCRNSHCGCANLKLTTLSTNSPVVMVSFGNHN